jgi:hypothetical protein
MLNGGVVNGPAPELFPATKCAIYRVFTPKCALQKSQLNIIQMPELTKNMGRNASLRENSLGNINALNEAAPR